MANELSPTMPRQPRPTEAEITAFWSRVTLAWRSDLALSTSRWVQEMKRLYANGGVVTTQLELVGECDVFDWFAQRNQLDAEIEICRNLLGRADVVRALFGSEVAAPVDGVAFEMARGFVLAGAFAEQLALGGSYAAFAGTDGDAQLLARELADGLTDGRASELAVFHTAVAWHRWFQGCAHFDRTWLIVDRRARIVTIVGTTDES